MKKNYFFSHLVLLAAIAAVAIVPARAQQLVDGVYQISNAEEFANFGNLVAQGADSINGALTADIDFSGVTWTPIGSGERPYRGEFNGNFHRIKNLVINSKEDYQGLFGYISSAKISNLFIDSSCSISGGSYVAGIAGAGVMGGTAYFTNCGNEASVTGTGANVAGIVGVSMASAVKFVIKNCYNSGNITGGRESAAICGWCAELAEVDGVVNTGTLVGSDGEYSLVRSPASLTNAYDIVGPQGKLLDAEAMASGALAFALNGNRPDGGIWCQNIDVTGQAKDAFPVPDSVHHAKVYASGTLRCDGAVTSDVVFSNTYAVPVIPEHNYVDGICTVCNGFEPNFVPLKDSVYEVSNAAQLNWIAQSVNRAENRKFYVRLMDDIDFGAYTLKNVVIGTSGHEFQGRFDGQGHTVNIDFETDQEAVSLFRFVKDAEVSNLMTTGTVSSSAKYASGIIAQALGATRIVNCASKVNIVCTVSGDATCGGIVGKANKAGKIINCGFMGSIAGDACGCNGGIVGWSDEGSISIDNCFVAADLQAAKADLQSMVFGRDNPVLTNCYYTVAGEFTPDAGATWVDSESLASGALCYALNGYKSDGTVWRQNIDAAGQAKDAFPMPDSLHHAKVYASGTLRCDGAVTTELVYTNTYSVPVIPEHDYLDGICTVCNRLEPNFVPLKDSVYEVSNAAQLNWIAQSVNRAESRKFYVRLMDDIDFGEYTLKNVVIGTSGHEFQGRFDGGGHTVNINFETDQELVSLFRFVKEAEVCNLITEGTVSSSAKYASGIIAQAFGATRIVNCVSKVNIVCTATGDATCGGIVGKANKAGKIINCGFIGSIAGDACGCNGGIVGWSDEGSISIDNCFVAADLQASKADLQSMVFGRNNPILTNCYYTDAGKFTPDAGSTPIDGGSLASGMLCYALNAKADSTCWFQNLDNDEEPDAFPVPFVSHAKVYPSGSVHCDGTPSEDNRYSNTEGQIITLPHDYQEGVCSFCHAVKEDYMQPVDGYYELRTPGELNWFARMVNLKSENAGMNARMMNDIDFSEISERDSVMIGVVNMIDYTGTFDGQGHKLTIRYVSYSGPAAPFRTANNATVKNLYISGSITQHAKYAASVFYWCGHTLLENCVSDVNIECDLSGDATIGGLAATTDSHTTIRNCAFYGSINAPNAVGNGGIVGWSGAGRGEVMENCIVDAELTLADGDNFLIARNNPTVVNCYYVDPGKVSLNATAQEVDASQLSSGEIAFLLNGYKNGAGPWVQNIGTDAYPYPTGDRGKVYAIGTVACEGALIEATYSNTEGELKQVPHQYGADGICTVCGARLISTPAQLLAAAGDFNNGYTNPNMPIKLGADIDMTGITDYAGIGTETVPYIGHFDGQGHVISNLKMDSNLDYQGLFNMVGGGAVIENVVLDSTSSVKCASHAAGIVAACSKSADGTVTIRNCGNEAAVTVDPNTGVNAAGILGVNLKSAALVRISNCYNTGKISGHAECAGISGWLGGYAEVTNAYNIGHVEGLSDNNTFYRSGGNAPYLINCYETIGSQVNNVTDEQVTGGALCFMLNGKVQGGEPYSQTLGTEMHPVLFGSNSKVYEVNGNYTNDIVGIDETKTTPRAGDGRTHIYTVDGVEIPALQKGINIVREADGSVKKVLVK